jgi:putative ubiquitin-RnfH superfamily antitoxin RatB of RatAB toxin-antitoxin module
MKGIKELVAVLEYNPHHKPAGPGGGQFAPGKGGGSMPSGGVGSVPSGGNSRRQPLPQNTYAKDNALKAGLDKSEFSIHTGVNKHGSYTDTVLKFKPDVSDKRRLEVARPLSENGFRVQVYIFKGGHAPFVLSPIYRGSGQGKYTETHQE